MTTHLYAMLKKAGVQFDVAEETIRTEVPELFDENTLQLGSIFDREGFQVDSLKAMPKEPIPISGFSDMGAMRPLTMRIAGLGEVRIDKVDPRFIDKILLNPVVQFAVALKTSPLIDKWRDRKTWVYRASTPELAEMGRAGFYRFLYQSIASFVTSYYYGASWNEVVWELRSAGELGCDEKIVKPDRMIWCPKPVRAINPHAIQGVLYTKATRLVPRQFDGFSMLRTDGEMITIDVERALVITHNKRFGDVKGLTGLLPVVPYVHMYEMVLKSAMQYYDRMGVPLALVYYPSREKVTDERTGKVYPAYEWALKLGEDATKYTALAIPSDTTAYQDEKETQKWRIEFPFQANNQSAGQVFEAAIRQLEQMIMRGIVVADRVGTQTADTGSYALAEIHQQVTDQHTQTILYELMAQVESYLFPKFVRYNMGDDSQYLTLDMPRITEDLRNLQNIFGNLVQVHPQMGRVDLVSMAERLNIPTVDEETYQAQQLDQAELDRQVTEITTPPEMLQPQAGGVAKKPAAKKPAAKAKPAAKKSEGAKKPAAKTTPKPASKKDVKPAAKK